MVTEIFRKTSLYTISYFIPLAYISHFVTGINITTNPGLLFLIALTLSFPIIITPIIIDTFSIKKRKEIILFVINTVLTIGIIYLVGHYYNVIAIKEGMLYLKDFGSNQNIFLTQIQTNVAASILFSIWGIIVNILIDL